MKKSKGYVQKQSKAKQKDLFSTSHQQVISKHFLGSRAPVHVAVASEDKHLNNEGPPRNLYEHIHTSTLIPI